MIIKNEGKTRYNEKRILSYRSDRSGKMTRYKFMKSTCRNFKNKNLYFAMIFSAPKAQWHAQPRPIFVE